MTPATTVSALLCLKGFQGVAGIKGEQGKAGAKGPEGDTGAPGPGGPMVRTRVILAHLTNLF